jgi:FkbM family methyltransferase
LCENIYRRYCVPKFSQHRPVPQEVMPGEVWELETINFMRQHLADRDVVHAGMYFGDFLPGLASALAAGRTIYGFEPHPENYACTEWTAVLNALTNVRLCNAGLGTERKRTFMRTASNEGTALGGASHVVDDWTAASGSDEGISPIELVTVDDEVPVTANVGIVQLDVEGYEASALLGSLETIRRCRPIIIVETFPAAFAYEHLVPLGYVHTGAVSGNAVFAPK